MIRLHNTRTQTKQEFTPQVAGKVSLYTCGPTVYDYLHIGNWSAFIYWDVLVRVLVSHGLTVTRVLNVTDVGHLVSDADEGEDKLEKGAKRDGKTAWDVAKFYGDDFLEGMKELNLITPTYIAYATKYIPEQLELVRQLKDKGYTYQIDDGIYFDTSKFPTYADFAHLDLEAMKAGARVSYSAEKRNPSDFALWKFSPKNQHRDMEWLTPQDILESDTPNIMGFPGWHLECSAMAMSLLGETLDIHTGGIDHIPVHHTNEIAQSEAATGKMFSHYWLHSNHITADGTKISKSLNNGYTLQDLANQGYTPMDYRMFVLQSHYRTESNFTFENLAAAHSHVQNWRNIAALRHQLYRTIDAAQGDPHNETTRPSLALRHAIRQALDDDLNTPLALRLVDEAFSEISVLQRNRINKVALITAFEEIDDLLGFTILDSTPDITTEQKQQIIERDRARDAKDWEASDKLRYSLDEQGIVLSDTPSGTIWQYK